MCQKQLVSVIESAILNLSESEIEMTGEFKLTNLKCAKCSIHLCSITFRIRLNDMESVLVCTGDFHAVENIN